MILTLIALGILIIGIALVVLNEKTDIFDEIEILGGLFIIVGIVASIMCIGTILLKGAGENIAINKNRMTYESLQRRIKVVNSEYEDASKSNLIKDINEWNKEVYNKKYWAKNPWTNWLINQKVVDELEYIDFEEVAK